MEKKRPGVITAVCIIGFIGVAFTIPMIFSDFAKSTGDWYPPYLAFSAIIGLVSMIGLWKMKKWGVIVYAALVALSQIVLLATGLWNILALILPAILIAIVFSQFSKMK